MIEPNFETLPKRRYTPNSIRFYYPEFYKMLVNDHKFDFAKNFSERLYCYVHKIYSAPVCEVCGNPVTFINATKGYHRLCSHYCSIHSPLKILKTKRTNLERYGNEWNIASKNNRDKKDATCLKKYGVVNPAKTEQAKQKKKETCLEKFGVEYVLQSEIIKKKIEKTCLQKYGKKHVSFLDQKKVKDKIANTRFESLKKKYPYIIDKTESEFICKCTNQGCDKCKEKQFIIPISLFRNRIEFGYELCTISNPKGSCYCTNIEKFVRDILDKNNIEYVCHDKTILTGRREIDIYVPSKKIGFECNGCFWHNDFHRTEKQYHLSKWKDCNEQGIELISLWDDVIRNFPEKVEKLILHRLHINQIEIDASQCTFKQIDSATCNEFIKKNYLYKPVKSSVCIGAFYQNELIAITSWSKQRGSKEGWELYRYCCLSNYEVNNLLKSFIDTFISLKNPFNIIYFSSNDVDNIKEVAELFAFDILVNRYWYIHQKTYERVNRSSFQKKRLVAEGYDANLSEREIAIQKGYWKIWDSGQTKWHLEVSK